MISEKKIVFLPFSLKRLQRFCLCLNAESINSLGVSFVWRDSRCNFFAESVFFNAVNRVSRFDILALQCPFLHCLLFRNCIIRCFVNALNFVLLRIIRYTVSYYLLFCCVLTLILLLDCPLFRNFITCCFVNALGFVLLCIIRYAASHYSLFCCGLTVSLLSDCPLFCNSNMLYASF